MTARNVFLTICFLSIQKARLLLKELKGIVHLKTYEDPDFLKNKPLLRNSLHCFSGVNISTQDKIAVFKIVYQLYFREGNRLRSKNRSSWIPWLFEIHEGNAYKIVTLASQKKDNNHLKNLVVFKRKSAFKEEMSFAE